MTAKINSVLDKTSSLVKFILQIIMAIGVISGILLYPVMTKINSLEQNVKDIKGKLEMKVDERIYTNSLTSIQQSLNEIRADIKWLIQRGR